MENEKKLTVSASPHTHCGKTTRGIMLDVILAMLPALLVSVFLFGPRTLLVTFVSVVFCMLFEFLSRKAMHRNNTLGDLSAIVTGMLLAFNLPSSIPLWMVVIGAAVSIIVAKQFFGGIGQNFANPALVGRIVLMMSFPVQMSDFAVPFSWKSDVDVITTATPLFQMKSVYSAENIGAALESAELPSLLQMFLGVRQGAFGEVCAAALLLGLVYLLIRRVIKPVIPLCYVGTVAVIMLIAGKGNFNFMLYQILSGGLLLGAIFMATDYTTSPICTKGKVVFAIGCGVLTALIRLFGSLPEGVSFSILIMNILVPHIEHLTTPKPFGAEKKRRAEK